MNNAIEASPFRARWCHTLNDPPQVVGSAYGPLIYFQGGIQCTNPFTLSDINTLYANYGSGSASTGYSNNGSSSPDTATSWISGSYAPCAQPYSNNLFQTATLGSAGAGTLWGGESQVVILACSNGS